MNQLAEHQKSQERKFAEMLLRKQKASEDAPTGQL